MTKLCGNSVAWMLAASIAFSVMSVCIRLLSPACDWAFVAFIRSLFAFTSAVLLAMLGGVALPVLRPARLWLRGMAGSLSLACSFYATSRLPLADSTALFCVHPLWIVLIVGFSRWRALSLSDLAVVSGGCAGVWLILGPDLGGQPLAAIVALLGSVAAAVSYIGLHRLQDLDARAVMAHFSAVSCVVTGLCWLFGSAGQTVVAEWAAVAPLLLMVGLAGTAGQLLQTRAFACGRPQMVSVVGLSQVLFGATADMLFWGRQPGLAEVAGFALTITATAWIYLTDAAKMRASPGPISIAIDHNNDQRKSQDRPEQAARARPSMAIEEAVERTP
jgi:drug/metabolite transporter (DMT)-like permease